MKILKACCFRIIKPTYSNVKQRDRNLLNQSYFRLTIRVNDKVYFDRKEKKAFDKVLVITFIIRVMMWYVVFMH